MSRYTFKDGLKDGIPIGLGYLFVSIGFGITAINYGIPVLRAVLISLSNLTSAGQVAGIEIIKDSAASLFMTSAVEMILTQLVINLRYSLMAISLTQKLDDSFNTPSRMFTSFFLTDEIYATASGKSGNICVRYMCGLAVFPILGWTAGTAIGALAANTMSPEISNIFGIAIYGMFISIVVPVCRKDRGVLMCAVLAALLSCLVWYLPFFSFISSGFRIIICSVLSSLVIAALIPHAEDEEEEA